MPVIDGIYTKDFPDLGRALLTTDLVPIAVTGDNVTYKVTIADIETAVHNSLSLAAFGSTPNANGLSLSGGVLNMQPASATQPGGVSTGSQTFAGTKTFSNVVATTLSASGQVSAGSLIVTANTAFASGFTPIVRRTSDGIYGTALLADFLTWLEATSANTASKLVQRDGSGNFSAGTITAALSGNATTATLASTVTTNANLTGPITSVGNATSIASQTGTGSVFVVQNTPTLTTPVLGVATATSLAIGTTPSTSGSGTLMLPNDKPVSWRNQGNSANIGFYLGTDNIFTAEAPIKVGTNPATAGSFRLSNDTPISWRNAANSANIGLYVSASNRFTTDVGLDVAGTITATNLTSGTYTPTLTNTTNITSSTALVCFYQRVGNIVFVNGSATITATSTGTTTVLGVSLPVASNIGASTDLKGFGISNYSFWTDPILSGDSANDRATLTYAVGDTAGTQTVYFQFSYSVL